MIAGIALVLVGFILGAFAVSYVNHSSLTHMLKMSALSGAIIILNKVVFLVAIPPHLSTDEFADRLLDGLKRAEIAEYLKLIKWDRDRKQFTVG